MDGSSTGGFRADRHPSESYEDILERDSVGAPDHLRQQPRWDEGTDAIPIERYFDPGYFAKEVKYLWSKVWQWACREEEIPNVGDYRIYENVGKSLIVVRAPDMSIKAFYNSCLHRGRKLVTLNGCRNEFRCPYHGMAWTADGAFKDNPIGWDFPQWDGKDMSLPQAKVDTWGGFVFVNFDLNARPLIDYIGPIADHFERYDWTNRYKAVHIQKVIKANWKVATEAFMESHHSITTHPQLLPSLADANSQYDLLSDHVSRQFSAGGVASPFLESRPSENEILQHLTGRRDRRRALSGAIPDQLPEGMTARQALGDMSRAGMSAETGKDYSHASDAEMLDPLLYNLFPNFSIWAGYTTKLVYRWLPVGLDPERATMEIILFAPIPKDGVRPPPAAIRYLDENDSFMDVEDLLGTAAQVFQQDMGNLPYVQEGLRASGIGVVHYGRYSEGRIRHLHHMIHRYIEDGEAAEGVAGR
jgi:phenylpropionate dioxygenase-like ring-hydroxylating dioxygenase large terminal subunit